MKLLIIESWLLLFYLEGVMFFRSFKTLHRIVREQKMHPAPVKAGFSTHELCHAVDLAGVFYFKPVLCLQRSAATTILLRRRGRWAEMVIGAQVQPFRSHAWVEIENQIVNDQPHMHNLYHVLERC